MSEMKFRAHETFFIRKGWLSKGMKAVADNPYIFMGVDNSSPMDELGLGANMVKSLRYWMQATGLSKEPKTGKRYQTLTDHLGKIVYKNDPYLDEIGTLWAIHCNLATNKEMATSWFFFFNIFNMKRFVREDFVRALERYIKMNSQENYSSKSLQDDFNCLLGTYISREKMQDKPINPENNIDCPLGELAVIGIDNKAKKQFKKKAANPSDLDALIVLYAILRQKDIQGSMAKAEITLDSLLNGKCSPGKLFNLDSISLLNYLYELENEGYLRLIRTAGLDVVRFPEGEQKPEDCLNDYYRSINRR